MTIKQGRTFIRVLITASLALLVLAACSTVNNNQTLNTGSPTHQSLYYFTVGSYSQHQGNFQLAGNLLEKAKVFDNGSAVIRKYILLNNVYLYYNDLISKHEFEQRLKAAESNLMHDEQVLLALYSVSAVKKDTLQIDRYLSALEHEHPSSSVYLWRFYYNHTYRQQIDKAALLKAEELATTEPENLLQLARIYSLLDPRKALVLLDRVNELQPSPEASSLITALRMSLQDEAPVNEIFDGYVYPHDREQMIDFLNTALEQGDSKAILRNADAILKTGDSALLTPLTTLAFSNDDTELISRISSVMDTRTDNTREDSRVYAILIAYAVVHNDSRDLTSFTSRLWSLDDVQTVLGLSVSFFGNKEGIKFEEITPPIYEKCVAGFSAITSDSLMVSFMQLYAMMQYATINSDDFVKISAKLSREIIERGYGDEKDYLIVTQDLQIQGHKQELYHFLEKAIDLFPANSAFLNSLGYSLLSEPNRLEEGGALIRRALDISPNEPFYLDSLAWYHYLKGEYRQALDYMSIPIQMEELPAEISYHIAMIYRSLGDFPNARIFFQKTIDSQENNEYIPMSRTELERLP